MSTYTTIQGDRWDTVSYKALGSATYVDRLIMLNTEYKDYYIFPAGITLELPEVGDEGTAYIIPPWKEVVG